MQINRHTISPTKLKLSIATSQDELDTYRQHVLKHLSKSVKLAGFRAGKAPKEMIEKQIDQATLQAEFLDHAINELYVEAVRQENIRPVAQPSVSITKFVPFTTLEFDAEVETVGEITLADYKKIKLSQKSTEVTAQDVTDVIDSLRNRAATKEAVKRAAKLDDEVVIDFVGVDTKTKAPIRGADGKEYPLVIGSKTFIPGFEEELIGLKPGDEKSFDITFPKDYGVPTLQNKNVTFTVTVSSVLSVTKAKLDDAFAASVGPFKTVSELKSDIKKQLSVEKKQEAQRLFDNELLQQIADKSDVAIPDSLIEEEIDRIEEEEKRNTAYRGQTWQEHLDAEGVTAEEHRNKNRASAELRVKGGLVLSEIAEAEKITITPEELEIRMQLLKGQYPDPTMQAELDKPENRRDVMSRMLTEKTLDRLRAYSTK